MKRLHFICATAILPSCFLIGMAAAPAGAQVVPLSYWTLGESSGDTAYDMIGDNHGTYVGGYELGQAGIRPDDTAVRMWTDRQGYIEAEHRDAYVIDEGTLHFAFRDTGSYEHAGIISKDALSYGTGGHLTAYTSGGPAECLRVRLRSTDTTHTVWTPMYQLDQWYDITFSWGGEGMKLYMDGDLIDEDAYTGGLGLTSGGLGNLEPLLLGASAARSGSGSTHPRTSFFSGLLDDIAIFDQQLTAREVESSLSSLRAVPLPSAAGLAFTGLSSLGLAGTRRRRA